MRKFMTSRKGFTLIELMIVILIIAILVAIAVPVYLNSKSNAEKRTCQANQRTVDGAIQSYQANDSSQRYPASWGDMTAATVRVIKTVPTCPSGGTYTLEADASPPFLSCTKHPPQGN
jgi:type IV pilus assembly protein PilA